MNAETVARFDRSKVYVVYCDGIGCNASTKGAYKLARLGFRAKELLGGLDWWRRDGHEVTASHEPVYLEPRNSSSGSSARRSPIDARRATHQPQPSTGAPTSNDLIVATEPS